MSKYNSSYSGSHIDTAVGRLYNVNLGKTTASKAITVDGSKNVENINNLILTGKISGSDTTQAEFATITGSTIICNGSISGSLTGEFLALSGSNIALAGNTLSTNLGNLTDTEITQLENIGAKTISNTQWGYVGSADQSIAKSSAATFTGMTYNGDSGSALTRGSLSELITVASGSGISGVDSSANLAPANSLIDGVAFRVTQAPGGGATELNVGRKLGGNIDEFISSQSCDVIDETGVSFGDNDASQLPIKNRTGQKLTITTDADVDTTDMKVRVVVFYKDITAPTS